MYNDVYLRENGFHHIEQTMSKEVPTMKRYGRLAAALIGLLLTAGLLFVLETQVQGVSIAPPTFSDTVGIGKIVYATSPPTQRTPTGSL